MPTAEIEGFSGESDFRSEIGEHWLAKVFTVVCNSSIWVSGMFWFVPRTVNIIARLQRARQARRTYRKIVFEHIGS